MAQPRNNTGEYQVKAEAISSMYEGRKYLGGREQERKRKASGKEKDTTQKAKPTSTSNYLNYSTTLSFVLSSQHLVNKKSTR